MRGKSLRLLYASSTPPPHSARHAPNNSTWLLQTRIPRCADAGGGEGGGGGLRGFGTLKKSKRKKWAPWEQFGFSKWRGLEECRRVLGECRRVLGVRLRILGYMARTALTVIAVSCGGGGTGDGGSREWGGEGRQPGREGGREGGRDASATEPQKSKQKE